MVSLSIILLLNHKYPAGSASGHMANPAGGAEGIFFGDMEPQWDVNLYLSGTIISGYMTVYFLDGHFEGDEFTEDDIIEKHIIRKGEFNVHIYVGDTTQFERKTVRIEYSDDFSYSEYTCVYYPKREGIDYLMDGLFR